MTTKITPPLTLKEGSAGLKVKNLRKSFKSKPILRDINLSLSRGEVVALLGPNGAGKTTCFYSIAGLINPDSGSIEIDGKDVTDLPERRKRLDSLLAEFSIAHIRQASAISLSGGERRRVEIARCLAIQPKYILLDEPFAGVDPIAVNEIRLLVSHLKDRDIGILITDHNVRETLQIVDRAYILHDGKVIMSGSPEEVIEDKTVRHVYLGDNYRA